MPLMRDIDSQAAQVLTPIKSTLVDVDVSTPIYIAFDPRTKAIEIQTRTMIVWAFGNVSPLSKPLYLFERMYMAYNANPHKGMSILAAEQPGQTIITELH